MQTHFSLPTTVLMLTCLGRHPALAAQQHIQVRRPEQAVVTCLVAAGIACYGIKSYLTAHVQELLIKEHQQTLEQLSAHYQTIPDAYSEEYFAKRASQGDSTTDTLRAERDAILHDRLRLQQIQEVWRTTKIAPGLQQLEALLKKLHSLENNLSQAIAPFDLALCMRRYAHTFKTLLAKEYDLHSAISNAYPTDLYPYLACTEALKDALTEIKEKQKLVAPQHPHYQASITCFAELTALYQRIVSMPQHHEQVRQKLQDMKQAEACKLRHKELRATQKQVNQLVNIDTKLQALLSKHDAELSHCLNHLSSFNLFAAQLNDRTATAEQKNLALQKLAAQAVQRAQETCALIGIQKQELLVAQQVQKNWFTILHDKIERLETNMLPSTHTPSPSPDGDNPGEACATEPCAPAEQHI